MTEIKDDLISREVLKKQFDDYIKANPNLSGIFEVGKYIIDNAPTVKFSLLPADESKDEAYMRGYEHGLAVGLLKTRPTGEWGKWVITEIRCPECLEFFNTDCYSTEELKKCPCCGATMKGGVE